jgi:Domain of unknown function (DUF4915)
VPPAEAPEAAALRSVHTTNLPTLFAQLQISLVVSTYQAGKVIVIRNEGPALNTHFRTFAKPMGLAADRGQLAIGGSHTVWAYHNVPAVAPKLAPVGRHDACYLPHRIHVTGDIDIHELAYDAAHELWLVNTRFGCLCTLDAAHSFVSRAVGTRGVGTGGAGATAGMKGRGPPRPPRGGRASTGPGPTGPGSGGRGARGPRSGDV